MVGSGSYFNDVVTLDDEYYLVQDAEYLDEPVIRPINSLLECERDSVQLMISELEQRKNDYLED